MTRWIVASSLKFRLLVLAAAAATLAVGITQLRDMPVDVLPEYAPPTVEVQTEALGLSAAEVEQLVTVPLEADLLNGVAFLQDIRSESIAGLSRILLVFEPGTDLYRARQVVNERVAEAHVAMSGVSRPSQMLQPLSSTNRVMMVSVSTDSLSPIQMSVLARWTIVPRLLGVAGVANVSIWGHRDRQLQVQVDPVDLRDQDVTLGQVIETAGNALWVSPLTFVEASTPGTGGFIDTANQRLPVQHLSPISTADHLAQVRVEGTNGRSLRLGDVANVVEGHQPLIGDAVVNDGEGLLLVIEKFPEANALDVTRGVEGAIASMQPGLTGVAFDTTVYRPASFIEQSIDNVTLALIIGAALLVLLLGAFLFGWRPALVAVVAIPLSLVVGALVLYAFGETMNAMVLAGLLAALILVVHEAIVGAESIDRRLRERRAGDDGEPATAVILDATLEVRSAAVFGLLIVALAVVPLFFLEGMPGSFFPPMAVALLAALGASMVVAVTVTPALSLLLRAGAPRERPESPVVGWLRRHYRSALAWMVGRPSVVYLAAGGLVVAAVAALPFLGQGLLPTFKEPELVIRWQGPPGTSLPEMNRITTLASRELRSIDGVRNVGADVGRAVTSDQVVSVNSAELWVSIDPDADYDETVASVKDVVAGYPGLAQDVQAFSNERAADALAGAEDDFVVRIYGEDLDVLREKAGEVRQLLSGIDGVVDEHVPLPALEPTLEVKVNLLDAQRHRVKPGDVRRAAATLLSGIGVGSLFEEQKVFDVVVWGTPETRGSLSDVRRLLIETSGGGHVQLGQVADVRIRPNVSVIERHAVSRYLDVAANVDGRDTGSVVDDVEQALDEVVFPLEFHSEVLAAERQPAGRLILIGIAAALGMVLLFQAAFGAWRRAALAFLTLPVAVAGGVLAALADGGTLSFGSYMGLLAVLGLAARNSVLLIGHFGQLEQQNGGAFGRELVLRGAGERFAPILITAAAAALVSVPVLILGGSPGLEILRPMAAVILGGVVTSTFLSLFVVPALYLRVGVARVDPTTRQLDA
ncbi:MAG: efflux RND transporter permease subunit [Gaiellaceae bacterium]